MIKKNVIHNAVKGRLDRVYCQFQIHSLDTPENQILRAALEQSLRFLRMHTSGDSLKTLWGWATEPRNALSGVTLRRIHPAEFHGIRYAGTMKFYKQPLILAKMILRALGFDPTSDPANENQNIWLPPYSIDMNELFERYCETLLREKYLNLWAGYGHNSGKNFPTDKEIGGLRPDFLLKNKRWILDAKYKYWYKGKWDRKDIEQLCIYSRHTGIREKLGLEKDQEPEKLIFLYPDEERCIEDCREEFLEEVEKPSVKAEYFFGIYKVAVPLCKRK